MQQPQHRGNGIASGKLGLVGVGEMHQLGIIYLNFSFLSGV